MKKYVDSPVADCKAILKHEPCTIEFRGEPFKGVHLFYECEQTGMRFTTEELDAINVSQIHNSYRQAHNFPFPEEIKELRNHYGIPASKMSEIMGFGPNQWRNYEDGEVPSVSNARSIALARSKSVFLNMLDMSRPAIGEKSYLKIKGITENLTDFARHNPPTANSGYVSYSPEKTSAIVRYFATRLNGVFFTKMNKLLFYTDFTAYGRLGRGLTGLEYSALDRGPAPMRYSAVYGNLDGVSCDEYIYASGASGTILTTTAPPEPGIFTPEETEILESVYNRFKDLNAGEISQLSHNEKGWIACHETHSLIPYSYAFELSE